MRKNQSPLDLDHIAFSETSQGVCSDDGNFDWKTGQFSAPTSNTGAVVVSGDYNLSLGWVTFSFKVDHPDCLMMMVNLISQTYMTHLQDEIVDTDGAFRGYKNVIRYFLGATLAYTHLRKDFILVIPQSTCDQINLPYLLLLIKDLLDAGGKITRLDLTIDDMKKSVRIFDIYQSYRDGAMVARTKRVRYGIETDGDDFDLTYEQMSIGSRLSQFYVRIYDKSVESKGKLDAIRFEAELKGALAHCSMLEILTNVFPLNSLSQDPVSTFDFYAFVHSVLGIISGKLDFRDPQTHSNINRRTRLAWWHSFLQGVSKIKVFIPKKISTVEKVKSWIERSVSTSLALMFDVLGDKFDEFSSSLLSLGHSRYRAKHKVMLNDALRC